MRHISQAEESGAGNGPGHIGARLVAGLAERAEDAAADANRPASAVELHTDEYVLWHLLNPNPTMGQANRLRFRADRVDAGVADVRAWFGRRDRQRFSWAVGSHAAPSDLAARLERAGARAADDSPLAVMVLAKEPPEMLGIEVRPVATFAEFEAQREIRMEAFRFSEEERAASRGLGEKIWREFRPTGNSIHVAYIDDEPAAAAGVAYTRHGLALLIGGATAERFRGRGAYRALVRSRWEEASRRGMRDVVVHAGWMSRPILERAGFRTVSTIDLLEDDADAAAPTATGPQPDVDRPVARSHDHSAEERKSK